ncbi:MAG TPA: NUDIX domain-containing protein [Pseudolysinimonas sp.]|nr:NUDIX domain-containing protein [Pseudolysinimonas sp.]
MPTPDFIIGLRELVGHHPLWLSGVTAVVVRGDEVLMIRRADNGRWAPVAGIIEPGEHPADTAEREVLEEAGVVVEVERIAGVDVSAHVGYDNGDEAQYLVIVVRCRWVSGDPYPADGEATEARWVPAEELGGLEPALSEASLRRIGWALSEEPAAAFRRA